LIHSADGIGIRGVLYDNNKDRVIVYCHRLLGRKNGKEVDLLLQTFSDNYDLLTFDFRGHRSSYGTSTSGGDEILDLRAMISFAKGKGYKEIFVLGAGMGGTVAARAASIFGNIDGLIIFSPSGFSRDISPFAIKVVSDITLDSVFGKIPVRAIAKTRLGPRYSAGFPLDIRPPTTGTPILIIHSENDRFVKLDRMKTIFKGTLEPKEVVIIPGEKHADDLIDRNTLQIVRDFLADFSNTDDASKFTEDRISFTDMMRFEIEGDFPVPASIIKDDLHYRLHASEAAPDDRKYTREYIKRQVEDILSFRGYTRASVSLIDSVPHLRVSVRTPRIDTMSITGNRWVEDDYIRGILRLGNDYYNAYELDLSVRRLASEPAIRTVKSRLIERGDGDIDIRLDIAEQKAYRLLLSTKFTDIDDYFGLGVTWNEFNPPAFQYEAKSMFGISRHDLLTYFRASKSILRNALRFNATYFDIIKSRDDIDYIFTRQEVHEVGGEFSTQYRITENTAIDLSVFEKHYKAPVVSQNLPVESGTGDGVSLKLYVAGKLPLQGAPSFWWKHTFYYQKMGLLVPGQPHG
jgi:pimeloyl-ACP methyl ester carboxylesterase